MTVIMGIDLSLRAPAAVVLRARWKPGEWNIPAKTFHTIDRDSDDVEAFQQRRVDDIIRALVDFSNEHNVTDVFIEDYAYGMTQGAAHSLIELGGCVKRAYWQMARTIRPVNISSARKTLLGKVPSKKSSGVPVKDFVNNMLTKMGAKFSTMDEGDAFVVANHARSMMGLSFVGLL